MSKYKVVVLKVIIFLAGNTIMAAGYNPEAMVGVIVGVTTLEGRLFLLEQNQGYFNSFLNQLHVNQQYQNEQQDNQVRRIMLLERRSEQIEEECIHRRQAQLLMRREQENIAADMSQVVDRMFEYLQGRIERELKRVDEQLQQLTAAKGGGDEGGK